MIHVKLCNSGSGHATRYMWNSGFFSTDNVNLTPYSVMRAAQVFSDTVGKVLKQFGPAEDASTANFCLMVDKCFDCLNVRNTIEQNHFSNLMIQLMMKDLHG